MLVFAHPPASPPPKDQIMRIYAAVFNQVHKVNSVNLDCAFQIWNPKNGQKPPEPKVQAHFQTYLHCKAAIDSSQTCVTNYVKG